MSINKLFYLFLSFITVLFISACSEGNGEQAEEELSSTKPSAISTREFYHAWLADCVNDKPYKGSAQTAKSYFEGIAKTRVTSAIGAPSVIKVFGQETLVWGPAVYAGKQGTGKYVARNVMYCVVSTNASGRTYSIGISGTDMVSPFDWMAEDLDVDSLLIWAAGGKISRGSATGFKKLNSLVDSSTGKTLLDYLNGEMQNAPSATINIAGHSLGGALTQVYSSYVNFLLKRTGATPKVNAWVYAGPTAGDAAFAGKLTTSLDSYQSFSNVNDVIPHAWEKTKLKQLCGLYENAAIFKYKPWPWSSEFYYRIGSPAPLKGVVYYLRSKSKNGNYTDPGLLSKQYSFNMGTAQYMFKSRIDFDLMDGALATMYNAGHNDLYKNLNKINMNCTGSSISEDEFKRFFYYMIEMGTQHTTAYFDHFFMEESTDFKNVVSSAVPGGKTDWNDIVNGVEGKKILENFLKEVASVKPSSADCGCNTAVN